jgi:predicted cupin superfamily sugar epimerase
MNAEARRLIAKLALVPLPGEGGYFRERWTSATRLRCGRGAASAIYFLMTPEGFSAWHRLAAEELWFFHAGDAVEHIQLDPPTGRLSKTRLGAAVLKRDVPQLRVPGGVWQGARLAAGAKRGWALISCVVSPSWDQSEFELADPDLLRAAFPENAAWVGRLTR